MTNQLAIILGAAIIGLSIVGAQFVGRYAISATGGAGGNAVVWRVDSLTGDVQICTLTPSDNPFDTGPGRPFNVKCRQSIGGLTPAPKP